MLHIHRVLHTALAQAVKWGYLARNVADQATPPRVDGEGAWEATAPAGSEVLALLDAAEASGDRLRALWQLAVSSGLRLGD